MGHFDIQLWNMDLIELWIHTVESEHTKYQNIIV